MGLDGRWRRLRGGGGSRGTGCSTPRAGPATSRLARSDAGGSDRPRLLRADARAGAAKVSEIEWVKGMLLALPFEDASSTPRRSASGSGTSTTSTRASRASRASSGRAAGSRCSRSRGRGAAAPVLPALVRRAHPARRQGRSPAAPRTATCLRACVAFPARTTWPTRFGGGLRRRGLPAARRRHRLAHVGRR